MAISPLVHALSIVILQRLGLDDEVAAAEDDLVRWEISRSEIYHAYVDFVSIYGRKGRLEASDEILEQLKLLGIPLTMEIFHSMLASFSRTKMEGPLTNLLETMYEKWGVAPDSSCINQLLRLYSSLSDVTNSEAVFGMLQNQVMPGTNPDAFSYNYLICVYGRVGRVSDAFAKFEEMTRTPRVWTKVFPKIAYDFAVYVLEQNKILDESTLAKVFQKWNRSVNMATSPMSDADRSEFMKDFMLWRAQFKAWREQQPTPLPGPA